MARLVCTVSIYLPEQNFERDVGPPSKLLGGPSASRFHSGVESHTLTACMQHIHWCSCAGRR